jgi:hypothetical protein
MFYILAQDWSCPSAEEIPNSEVLDPYSLYSGRSIDPSVPPLRLIVPRIDVLCDVVVNPWRYLVWSSRLREVLASLTGDPIQYLPTVVAGGDGQTSNDYKLANPLVQIDAIDEELSSLRYNPDGYIEGVESLVLDEERIAEKAMFRLRSFPVELIVNEHVAKGAIQSGCTGTSFIPISDYRV